MYFFAATSKLGGKRIFCQCTVFLFSTTPTLGFSSHHLPHVAAADNRLHGRGAKNDEESGRNAETR